LLSTKICPKAVLLKALSGNVAPDDVLVDPADGADVACTVGSLVEAVVGVIEVGSAVVGSTVGKLPNAAVG
jgi:hypothetical protein